MKNENSKNWYFNKQINLSVVIQIILLASLILTSWVNLQRQLDLLQHDVTLLLQCQKEFQHKLESLTAETISHEYRLRAVEKTLAKDNHKNPNHHSTN